MARPHGLNSGVRAALVVALGVIAGGSLGGCANGGAGGGSGRVAAKSSAAGAMSQENAVVHTYTPAEYAQAHSAEAIRSTRATLYVNGMGCPLCVSNVDKQLERVKGVESVKVDLGAGTVDVGLMGKTKPSAAQLAEAVDNAGLTLVKIKVQP